MFSGLKKESPDHKVGPLDAKVAQINKKTPKIPQHCTICSKAGTQQLLYLQSTTLISLNSPILGF